MGTQQKKFPALLQRRSTHALRGTASLASTLCVLFGAVIGIGAVGCATTPPKNEKTQESSETKVPPVLFLHRKDRERMLEQQRIAQELAKNGNIFPKNDTPSSRHATDTSSVSDTTLANVFALPTATKKTDIQPLPIPLGVGDTALVGVGRDQATVAMLLQYDLATAKQRVGSSAIYTLQIARYGLLENRKPTPEELASFRSAAEEAVLLLRSAGDEAYFYHGLAGSTVTIGLFEEADYVTQTRGFDGAMKQLPRPFESARLMASRAKFPHNLVNGQTLEVRTRGSSNTITQPSFVVGVP